MTPRCGNCRHFTPLSERPNSPGNCDWLKNNPLPVMPFWLTRLSPAERGAVHPNQEGCKAHSFHLEYPEIYPCQN